MAYAEYAYFSGQHEKAVELTLGTVFVLRKSDDAAVGVSDLFLCKSDPASYQFCSARFKKHGTKVGTAGTEKYRKPCVDRVYDRYLPGAAPLADRRSAGAD